MCLAVPAKITRIEGQMATIDVGGVSRTASLALLPAAAVDDFVLVHAGFAISLVDRREAEETLKLMAELLGGAGDSSPDGDGAHR